jgi:hypothetical protein
VAIEKKKLSAKKRKGVEAKKRNRQMEAFVRQLLKDDMASKIDSFKDIPSLKKRKGVEEEEVVDSKMTKKKMDIEDLCGSRIGGWSFPGVMSDWHMVWTNSWLCIAGADYGLTGVGAGEEQARKVMVDEASKCGEVKQAWFERPDGQQSQVCDAWWQEQQDEVVDDFLVEPQNQG